MVRIVLAFLFLHTVVTAQAPAPQARDESWWTSRHNRILAEQGLHGDARLVMIGDSITQNYEKSRPPDENFQPTWLHYYAPRHAVNLGYSADTTANVLWRLQHGELNNLRPQVAVVLVGINDLNLAHRSAQETEAGVEAVVVQLRHNLPKTKIVLLGLLPNALPQANDASAVNKMLSARYGHDRRVHYVDISSAFIRNGALDEELFYDPRLPQPRPALHPDTVGQCRMADFLEPTIARLLHEKPLAPFCETLRKP